ncbi:hypothetical protein ACMGDM_13195 [Sphingomonas sp. DT-51]|uniref:hypothetical protein n=1 Tax=Sphingomonas sp. DT-51 TaxID=3396165 RepID=UPI003F1B22FE
MSDRLVAGLALVLVLILPVAALMARAVPMKTIARYAGAWLLIFTLIYLIAMQFT